MAHGEPGRETHTGRLPPPYVLLMSLSGHSTDLSSGSSFVCHARYTAQCPLSSMAGDWAAPSVSSLIIS